MEKVYLERPSVCELLQEKLKKFRKEHPKLTGAQISRRMNITTSTLNRIESGDIKTPTIDQAVKILRKCCCNGEVAMYMKQYYPDIHSVMLEYFKEAASSTQVYENLDQYFCDESTYLMMLFATTPLGLSENWVLQEYGRNGHQKFMNLAARGVFKNFNGRFFATNEFGELTNHSNYQISLLALFSTIQNISKELVEDIVIGKSPKSAICGLEYINVNFDKISDRLKELNKNYYSDIKHLIYQKENQGEDLLIVSNLSKIVRTHKV